MKIGIIGTGIHGSRYANHITGNDVPGLQLTAISRRSAAGRDQARDWRCTYYPEWRELVGDPDVEAVIGVTPPGVNLAIARACVAAGKPLLLEKPLAINGATGQEIVSLFAKAGLPLSVAQTLRFNPVIRALRQELHRIGHLHSVVAQQHLEPSTHSWLTDPNQAGAGVTLQTAVHIFDALRFITGQEVVQVRGSITTIHTSHLEDLMSAELLFTSGARALIQASKVSPARFASYDFLGQEGILQADQIHHRLHFIHGMHSKALPLARQSGALVPLLAKWLDFLKGRGPNPVSGLDGLTAVRIGQAILDSAESGQWQEVGSSSA